MTNSKMEKGIQKSMLDDLLDDSDKPKPPAPPARSYGYGYDPAPRYNDGYDWDRGDPLPRSMSDDDEADIPAWMRTNAYRDADEGDSGTYGHRRALPARSPHQQRTSIFKQSHNQAPLGGASHAVSDLAHDIIDAGTHKGGKVYLRPDQVTSLVNLYMRELGTFNDRAGLCWSSEGSKIIRAGLEDLMGEMYAGTSRIISGDDFDAETGEVFDKSDLNHEGE